LKKFVFKKTLLLIKSKLVKRVLLFEIVHSNSSKIPEKIKKNRIFCIIKRIKTVVIEIISNINSLIKLFPDAEPRTAVQTIIQKSINRFTGIVKIKIVNIKKPPIAHNIMLL